MVEINNDVDQSSDQKDESTSRVWLWILLAVVAVFLLLFLFKKGSESSGMAETTPSVSADPIVSAFGISE
tara:strand:+ start:7945 stop:8154 length:210 start_codon:yes stop_codon:yes gene_type:complete